MKFEKQIEIFKTLDYEFVDGVSKELILDDVYEMTWEEETEKYIEENPFLILYYLFGWGSPAIKNYNYSDKCIYFDLEFFDTSLQYKWFMERMGAITNGEIHFSDITIETDLNDGEWINFKVNNISKRWKIGKTSLIVSDFVQHFSSLHKELGTSGQYTYYSDGGQQWVIDYANVLEQERFNEKTGLNREWLGEGGHFVNPSKNHDRY